jgi:hypothetical protein
MQADLFRISNKPPKAPLKDRLTSEINPFAKTRDQTPQQGEDKVIKNSKAARKNH